MTSDDAIELLKALGAQSRLIRHGQLVAEAAMLLCDEISAWGPDIDRQEVLVGALVHDAGKIVFPEELTGPGNRHEAVGEQFLIEHGVPARVARFCRTHASPAGEVEDLIVATADRLWCGRRNDRTEMALVHAIADQMAVDDWLALQRLGDCFELIATKGDDRLARQIES